MAIDVNGDKSVIKEIFTFFDKAGRIFERFFFQNGIAKRRNCYSYNGDIISVSKYTGNENFPSEQSSNEIKLLCNGLNTWHSSETYKPIYLNRKKLAKKAIIFKKVSFEKHQNGNNYARDYSFTVYPIKSKDTNKKFFSAKLENLFNSTGRKPKITQYKTENLDINMNDDFLPARILGIRSDNGFENLINSFLTRKHLNKMAIRSYTYSDLSPETLGCFTMDNTSTEAYIKFNNKFIKSVSEDVIINTVGHETDHALRYALIGRLGAGTTGYEREANKVLWELSPKEKEEALRCKIARDDYVPFEINPQKYYDNYLEVKAREAGTLAVNEFKKDRKNYKFFKQFDRM